MHKLEKMQRSGKRKFKEKKKLKKEGENFLIVTYFYSL